RRDAGDGDQPAGEHGGRSGPDDRVSPHPRKNLSATADAARLARRRTGRSTGTSRTRPPLRTRTPTASRSQGQPAQVSGMRSLADCAPVRVRRDAPRPATFGRPPAPASAEPPPAAEPDAPADGGSAGFARPGALPVTWPRIPVTDWPTATDAAPPSSVIAMK